MTTATENPDTHTKKTKAMHEALRQIPYGLYAIGVGATPREQNAFIASWVMQCSFDPPLIAVAIRNNTINSKLVKEEGVFTLNLLGKDQKDLARQLVKPSHRVGNKLGQIAHFEEETAAPILKDCLAFCECRIESGSETGDHLLIVGEVVNAHQTRKDEPLTCSDIGWVYGG